MRNAKCVTSDPFQKGGIVAGNAFVTTVRRSEVARDEKFATTIAPCSVNTSLDWLNQSSFKVAAINSMEDKRKRRLKSLIYYFRKPAPTFYACSSPARNGSATFAS